MYRPCLRLWVILLLCACGTPGQALAPDAAGADAAATAELLAEVDGPELRLLGAD